MCEFDSLGNVLSLYMRRFHNPHAYKEDIKESKNECIILFDIFPSAFYNVVENYHCEIPLGNLKFREPKIPIFVSLKLSSESFY